MAPSTQVVKRPNDVEITIREATYILPKEKACWVERSDKSLYPGWVLDQNGYSTEDFYTVVFREDGKWKGKVLPASSVIVGRDHMETGDGKYTVDVCDRDIGNPYFLHYTHANTYFKHRSEASVNRAYIWRQDNPGKDPTCFEQMVGEFEVREFLVKKYAWAVPDAEALQAIKQLCDKHGCGVVEIGAGRGYWAWMLKNEGVDVYAFDKNPPDKVSNHYFSPRDKDELVELYHPVLVGNEHNAAKYWRHVLLLVWPGYDDDWAHLALKQYFEAGGRHLVFVGEGQGGCCADDAFFQYLHHYGDRTRDLSIPHWHGVHDYLSTWELRPNAETFIVTRYCWECGEDRDSYGFESIYSGFTTEKPYSSTPTTRRFYKRDFNTEVCSSCYEDHIIQHLLPADCG